MRHRFELRIDSTSLCVNCRRSVYLFNLAMHLAIVLSHKYSQGVYFRSGVHPPQPQLYLLCLVQESQSLTNLSESGKMADVWRRWEAPVQPLLLRRSQLGFILEVCWTRIELLFTLWRMLQIKTQATNRCTLMSSTLLLSGSQDGRHRRCHWTTTSNNA